MPFFSFTSDDVQSLKNENFKTFMSFVPFVQWQQSFVAI